MDYEWSWGITGYQLDENNHAKNAELCRYAGVSSVEAMRDFVDRKSASEIKEIKKHYEEAGIDLDTFHLPFGSEYDVANFYETPRKKGVESISVYLEKAALLGCRVCIIHPTSTPFNAEGEGIDRYLRFMGKSLEVLLPQAEKLGLVLAIENMLPGDGGRFTSEPQHFELITKKLAHPNLGYCLDTGHAQISPAATGPEDFFDVMKDRLVAFHLQDNPGDRDLHLAPGHGLIDWGVVFERMADMHYSHPAVIEAPPFSYGSPRHYSRDAWKTMIEQTVQLAEEA